MSASATPAFVVDTSAAVAVILGEQGSDDLIDRLQSASSRLMSVASRVELGIVIEARLGPPGGDVVARFLRDAEIELAPVDPDAAERAMGAWRRFGKGRHRAALNFGDCLVYGLADQVGLPVLCTREDFAATDIEVLRPIGP